MGKIKQLKVLEEMQYCSPVYQEVIDVENNKQLFSACDLTETPEDCTLFRDLFNAWDYIEAIEYGMNLAKEGYDEIDYIVERDEEE